MERHIKALKELGEFFGRKTKISIQAMKELGEFLGGKLDNTVSAIDSLKEDISDSNEKNNQDVSEIISSLNITTNTLSKLPQNLSKDIVEALRGITAKLSSIDSVDPVDIQPIVTSLETLKKALPKIPSLNISKELKPVIKAIGSIDFKQDNGDVVKALKTLSDTIKKQNNTDIISAIEKIKIESPSTLKLDTMQFRALKPKATYQGPIPARNTKITRVTMTTADTEYSHTFHKGAVSWRIKMEAQNAKFNYSWDTGKLKVSGDASSYISIPANWLDSRDNAEYGAKTIYFESPSSSQTMEIEEGIA